MLTAAQIRHFHDQGWISPLDACGPDEVTVNRTAFERMRAQAADAFALNGCHPTCRSIWDLATNPQVVAAVRDLLGDELIVWGTHYFAKEPGDPRTVAWHQDGPYWPFTPAQTVTAWIAIDDSDEENGAMQVVPGSHHHGALPWRACRPDEASVLGRSMDGVERLAAPVSITLRAGQFSLHHDLLVHGSRANRSTRRRCGLTVRYCPPWVSAPTHPSWMQAGIRICGTAPAPGWAFPPRPEGDDPRRPAQVIGAN